MDANRLPILGATLAVALFLASPGAAHADLLHGIGVIGDSYSDEYQFQPDPRPFARNWVEILAATRGWNFGNFSTVSRGEPRRQGYEFNWARGGATSSDILQQGQHTGLAQQVASGQVTLAFDFTPAGNDFRALHAPIPPLHVPPTLVPDAVANTVTAMNTILAADPNVRLVVGNVIDPRLWPETQIRLQDGRLTQALVDEFTAAAQDYNAQIASIAARDSRVAVADVFGLFDGLLDSPDPLIVGGVTIDRINPDIAPDHFWVDNIHPGTVGQGLIANLFIDTINARFGAGVTRLSEPEIVGFASSVVPEPSSFVLLGIGIFGIIGYGWRQRKRGRTIRCT